MKKQITIKDLSIGYKDPLIQNISLSITSGQLIALIGTNGSGKSTLIKTLCGLIPSLAGDFLINDNNILKLKETERAKILSVLTTKPAEVYNITVFDYIAFGRYPFNNWLGMIKSNDIQIINQAINQCNIIHLKNKMYENLSDGEKQRVNIARAITQKTPLIILDEPSAHLDIVNKVELFKLLRHLTKEQNKTIIFSTHHIEYAIQVCDSIWTINNKALNSYTPNQLINNNLLNEMINNDCIIFDKDSKSFKIK